MAHQSELIATDIEAYLDAQQHKSLLRFITCGSVDDGKSSLIGRMLYEAHLVFEDHLDAISKDSKTVGTQGDDIDFALLLDGLAAEREQGITIDVAYRFFSTEKRKFIVADTPGHEQYTRNMATGASTADLAIILIDARKGVLTQTRRHSVLVSLLGIRHVVLAVNKMDLVDYDESIFNQIVDDYAPFAAKAGITDVAAIPLSALRGDNIVSLSAAMPWYLGPTLFEHLENVSVGDEIAELPARMAIQWVNRPNLDFRGFSGTVASGTFRRGELISVVPSGVQARIDRIVTMDGDLDVAVAGQSVTFTLDREIDASRGDTIAVPESQPTVAASLDAQLIWMAEQPLEIGRRYLVKHGTRTVSATFDTPRNRIDIATLDPVAASTLAMNEIGRVDVHLERALAFDPYTQNRATGSFIIIDRLTNNTVGAGLISGASDSGATNVVWHESSVDLDRRSELVGHGPAVVWFTGLSGSGKSTIANAVQSRLSSAGVHTYVLDGDNLRHGLNSDLGFSDADRIENIRRTSEVASLFADAGMVVLCSLISPFAADRDAARSRVPSGQFFEVFVDTPIEVAESRDPKGLYRKARAGEIKGFTGIDSPYEAPDSAELVLRDQSIMEAADAVIAMLANAGVLR